MADGIPWEQRVAKIRTWQRDGVRAPHKPLLLLYALGRLQRAGQNEPVTFVEAEGPLADLLVEFGPPRKSSPGYPFHHLESDGLWQVTTAEGDTSPGAGVTALRSHGASGMLDPHFADALLNDPALLSRVADVLLAANFPETLRDDIVRQVGLDLPASIGAKSTPNEAIRKRSPEFRDQVLMAYELRCAMCGFDGRLGSTSVGLEAAHVRWFNIDGPDTVDNGLCLCSLHHKLLDKGALGLTAERTVKVSARFVGVGRTAEELVLSLGGKELAEPLAGMPSVADRHISWHSDQVFKSPARV